MRNGGGVHSLQLTVGFARGERSLRLLINGRRPSDRDQSPAYPSNSLTNRSVAVGAELHLGSGYVL